MHDDANARPTLTRPAQRTNATPSQRTHATTTRSRDNRPSDAQSEKTQPASSHPDDGRAAADRTFVDGEGRTLAVGPVDPVRDRRGLREMYAGFERADRAQGVPPATPDRLEDWLETLLAGPGYVACDDGPVGHATLLRGDDGPAELAVFVAASHRDAGVGTELLRSLLDADCARDTTIRLSVKRHNRPAVALYQSFGFEVARRDRCELTMERSPTR